MCKAIKDGGQRCPEHRRDTQRIMRHVATETGAPLSTVREAFLHLRQESKKLDRGTSLAPEDISEGVADLLLDAEDAEMSRAISSFDPDASFEEDAEEEFEDYSLDGDMDADTYVALDRLDRTVTDHQRALESHLHATADRLGMTVEQVQQTFETYHTQATTSPTQYRTPATEEMKLRRDPSILPDNATMSALARLRTEGIRGPAIVTRQSLSTVSPMIKEGGYDHETGRLEIVLKSQPDKVMAWQGVSPEAWEKFSTAHRNGFSILNALIIGPGTHQYPSEDAMEREGYTWHCRSCGQFANSSHECPYRGLSSLDGGSKERAAQSSPPPLVSEAPTALSEAPYADLEYVTEGDMLDSSSQGLMTELKQVSTPTSRYRLSEGVETRIQWMNVNQLRANSSNGLPMTAPLELTFTIKDDGYDEYGNHLTPGTYRISGNAAVMSRPGGSYAFVRTLDGDENSELKCETCAKGVGQPKMGCVHLRYAAAHLPNVAQQMEEVRVRPRQSPAEGLPTSLGDYANETTADSFTFTSEATSFSRRRPVPGSVVRSGLTFQKALADTSGAYREYLMATSTIQAPPPAAVLAAAKSGREVKFSTQVQFDGGKHTVSGSVTLSPARHVNLEQLRCSCGRFVSSGGTCEHLEALQASSRIFVSPWLVERAQNPLTDEELLRKMNSEVDDTDSAFATVDDELATGTEGDEWLRAGVPMSTLRAAEIERTLLEEGHQGQELINQRSQRVAEVIQEEQIRAAGRQLTSEVEREEMAARLSVHRGQYEDYRNDQRARRSAQEPPLTPAEAKALLVSARASRRKGAVDAREYHMENVTDGVCDPSIPGSRRFGVELEYDFPFPEGTPEADQATANILAEMRAAGLTSQNKDTLEVGKTGAANGWKEWTLEADASVNGGELVSPPLADDPKDWEALQTAVDILKRNGAVVSEKTGMHVHVSTGSYDNSTAKHVELNQTFEENADTLYRLAADPARGTRRKTDYCAPNVTTPDMEVGGYGMSSSMPASLRARNQAINFGSTKAEGVGSTSSNSDWAKHHVEFRLWDGSLNASTIQQQVATSVALTERADRAVEDNGHAVTLRGANQLPGYHRLRGEDPANPSSETLDQLVDFAAKTFRTKQQQQDFFHHFGYNTWQR